MKVVLVNPLLEYVRGGAETNDLNLGRAFHEAGHEVGYLTVADSARQGLGVPQWAERESLSMAYSYDDDSERKGLLGKVARQLYFRRFVQLVKRRRPNILKEADLVLLTGRPILSGIRPVVEGKLVQSVRGRLAGWNRQTLRKLDGVIFWGGCEVENPEIVSRFPSISLFPSIDEAAFFPAEADQELRLNLQGGDESAKVAIFVGRLEAVKQVDLIIRALGHTVSQGHNGRLCIIGNGSARPHLEDLAREVAPGRVHFAGALPNNDVAAHLHAADFFVLYSRTENSPISIMEAIACGKWVLAPAIGRIPTLLSQPGLGQLVEPGSQDALNVAMADALRASPAAAAGSDKKPFSSWDGNARAIAAWAAALQPDGN